MDMYELSKLLIENGIRYETVPLLALNSPPGHTRVEYRVRLDALVRVNFGDERIAHSMESIQEMTGERKTLTLDEFITRVNMSGSRTQEWKSQRLNATIEIV